MQTQNHTSTIQFTYPPSLYIDESRNKNWGLHVWFPVSTFFIIITIAVIAPDFTNNWITNEQTGVLELFHWLAPFISALIAIRILFFETVRKNTGLLIWTIIFVIGGIYLAGEEASWGQHYFGWATPDAWKNVNDQQETNLHNISHWMDQKPRLILTVGVIFGGIVIPWTLIYREEIMPKKFDAIYPPLILVPMAFLVVLTEIYQQFKGIVSHLGISGIRPGEFQETYLVWFILIYMLFFYKRISLKDKLYRENSRIT